MEKCVFCEMIRQGNVMDYYGSVVAIQDSFPVSVLHTLILPIRCTPSYFNLTKREIDDIRKAIEFIYTDYQSIDYSIDGWNIGWNIGSAAGQTVTHAHCHMIPRRLGDVENPIGGIRNIIPGKGDYTK